MVIGCGGAGKSTLARKLAAQLQLPLVQPDSHYWGPGWTASDEAAWRARVSHLVAESTWIMDGNNSGTFDIRIPRADTVIWLDYSRATCFRRVLLRALRNYGCTRPESPEGCAERFDIAFLRYVWDFPAKHRSRIVSRLEKFGRHVHLVRLLNDRAAEDFLASVGEH
jgi:adenylate kinase family enzyme